MKEKLPAAFGQLGFSILAVAGLAFAALPDVQPRIAAQQHSAHIARPLSANLVAHRDETAPLASEPSQLPRNITEQIESFEGLRLTVARTDAYPSGVGTPFAFMLSLLVERGATVTDVEVITSGDGSCIIQSNLDIICTGPLTSLVISYRYALTPAMHPPDLIFATGGSDSLRVDYTLTVIYPPSWAYLNASVPPDSHDPTLRILVWTAQSANELRTEVRFQVAGLSGNWLPAVKRLR